MDLLPIFRRLRGPRSTIRFRLTAGYFGLFFLAGAALIALNYVLAVQYAYHPLNPDPARPMTLIGPSPKGSMPPKMGEDPATIATLPKVHAQQLEAQIRNQLRDQAVSRTLMLSLVTLGIGAAMSVALAWIAAGRALRPIQAIARAARHASEGDLHERVNLQGPGDELKDLADTIDGMLARLEAAFAKQRRFAANVSHELRTPLSILRTAVDVTLANPNRGPEAMDEMALEVRDATDRAERLIDSLLLLSRADEQVGATELVDLADAVHNALDDTENERRGLGLRVQTALEDAPVLGDRPLVERMVGNLVENAVRHNVRGGRVEIASGVVDGQAFVRVASTGPEIPADVLPTLFEPFKRLAAARTGSGRGAGLGLSIVRAVAVNHGGEVAAHPRPGGGIEVTATLPRGGAA